MYSSLRIILISDIIIRAHNYKVRMITISTISIKHYYYYISVIITILIILALLLLPLILLLY